MPRRKKNAQRKATGCKICGDKTVGRGIGMHVKGAHSIEHADYKT